MKEIIGCVLAILTALVSGVAIIANKFLIIGLPASVFTAVRALMIGAVFLVIILIMSKKGKSVKFVHSLKRNWKYLIGIGVVGGGLAFLLFFTGLGMTTGGRAGFLHKTLPLYVAVLAFVFLKEKLNKNRIIAMGVMFLGVILIYYTKIVPGVFWPNPSLGDLLVIGATVLWAVENVIARKIMKDGETNFVVSFARMFIGGLFLSGVILLFGDLGVLLNLTTSQVVSILISTGFLFFYVLFWYSAIRFIDVTKASLFLLIAPVVSLVLGIFILNEPAPFIQLVGSGLILIGAYFNIIPEKVVRV